MKSWLNQYADLFKAGLVNGLLSFIFIISTLLYWKSDGFSVLEISFMAILGGFFYFFTCLSVSVWLINDHIKNARSSQEKPGNKWVAILLILIVGFVVLLLLDLIYYQIDNSISLEFAEALKALMQQNNQSINGIDEFAKLPFLMQNGIVTFGGGLMGGLLAVPFIKKDGVLFKWNATTN
ncbi:hypothetical protein [Marinoscillum sp.]|uniref:hypothetical protein n=1 Tax=Marinoscillum sp. TaxID=2024838 RepID=UPI003BACE77C